MDAQYSSTWGKVKHVLNKYSKFIGSSIMISVAYIDPGNYATGTTAGATNKYSLLFIVLVANIIAIFLQSICIKLGSVTGFDLARCCREYLPKKVNWVLWFFAECAIIATDIAEVIGTAIALNILLKIPLPAGVVITIVDVLFVLMAYKSDTASVKFLRYFELFVGLLVIGVTVCFAIELSKLPIQPGEVKEILRGYAPSRQMIEGPGITVAASIMGATVMIHSLFLGSGIVQPRLREYDAKHGYINLNQLEEKNQADEFFYNQYKPSLESIRYSLKFFIIELIVTLCTFALFINSSILVIAGNTLFGTDEAVDADLYTIHKLLSENLAPVVGTIFMLALLFSGQSAGIVCTIAGQIVSEGHINWTVKPWLRRLITRGISIIPVLGISIGIGRGGLNLALNVSQLIISLLLPILTLPLIYFTSSKKIMQIAIPKNRVLEDVTTVCFTEGTSEENEEEYAYFHNSWLTMIVLIAIWLFVSVINVYAIYDLSKNGFMN